MSFAVPGSWVWDFWTAYDAGTHHLFFLHAPAEPGDPDLRHRRARVGHATSTDLRRWTRVPDPLPEAREGFDDLAQWTGSVVRGDDGWWLFSTGLTRADDGRVQRIGSARSTDLLTWERTPLELRADERWYHRSSPLRPDEPWRDPCVVRGGDGRWHAYVTAADRRGSRDSGVVGHAVSEDLLRWTVLPPLPGTGGRFECLEVVQVVQVEGRWALVFSAPGDLLSTQEADVAGTWSVAVPGPEAGPAAPVEAAAAVRLTGRDRYVGTVVHHAGSAYLLAFRHQEPGGWVGGITDPVPVTWRDDGAGLVLVR